MKKLILLLLISQIAILNKLNAQNISLAADTVRFVAWGAALVHDDLTSTTSTASVKWRVLSYDFPADWLSGFGICDNQNCYAGTDLLAGTQYVSDTFGANKKCDFHLQLNLNGSSGGTHFFKVEIAEVGGSVIDTAIFIVTKWPTAVKSIAESKADIALYPNPCTDYLDVTYNEGIGEILITNIIGSVVKKVTVGEKYMKVSMSELPKGAYLLDVTDLHHTIQYRQKIIKD